MSNALVSTIIPIYNGAAFLEEAVESVMTQDYRPLELLLINDGSRDESEAIARRFQERHPETVRYLEQENSGQSAARNRGVREARGELVAFLDQDDKWKPGKLSMQAELLRDNPGCAAVIGYSEFFRERDGRMESACQGLQFFFGSTLMRRVAFERVGALNENLRSWEDVDWFMRFIETGLPMLKHKDVVLSHRRHENNFSNQTAKVESDMLRLCKAMMNRRRAGAENIGFRELMRLQVDSWPDRELIS